MIMYSFPYYHISIAYLAFCKFMFPFREWCKLPTMVLMNVHSEWQLVAVNICVGSSSDWWHPQPNCIRCCMLIIAHQCAVHYHCVSLCSLPLCSCLCTQLDTQCTPHTSVTQCDHVQKEGLLTWVVIMMSSSKIHAPIAPHVQNDTWPVVRQL